METHETVKIPVEALYRDVLVELGKAKSYISEIEYLLNQREAEIEQLKSLSEEEKKEVKRSEFYKKQNKRLTDLQLKVRDYRKDINRYLTELAQHKIKNGKYENRKMF